MEIKLTLNDRHAQEHFDKGGKPALANYLSDTTYEFKSDGIVYSQLTGDEVGKWELLRA